MMKRAFVAAAALLCVLLTCTFADGRRADTIWVWDRSTTVTPGTPFTLDFDVTQGDERAIHLRVYRIAVDDAVAIVRSGEQDVPADVPGRLVWEGNAHGKENGSTRAISLGPFSIGLYVVQGSIGTASTGVLANVTTLGLVSMTGSAESAMWAVDLRTFLRHTGPTTVRAYGKHASVKAPCDADGIAILRNALPADPIFVAQSADGSVDIERFWNTNDTNSEPKVTYAQTDRPVYRPGQSVYFRAIVRSGYEDAYRIPYGKHRVEIDNQDGAPVFKQQYALSPFGTLNGEAKLPSYGLGEYSFKVDGDVARTFYVEAYKKPEYLLQATPHADAIVGGDDLAVGVHAAYVFGRAAAGMNLHYSAYSGWYNARGYSPYSNYYRLDNYTGDLPNESGDTSTGANGDAVLHIPTRHRTDPYFVNVSIDARDNSGRTVQTQTGVMVYPANVRLTLTPADWFAREGQDVRFDLASADVNGKALPNVRVQLRFKRTIWNPRHGGYDDAGTQEQSATTGDDGRAIVHWRPATAGSYLITAQAQDARGNVETQEQYLWVVGKDDRWLPPQDHPVLIPQHDTLGENERPRVLVRMPAPGRDVALAIATDHLLAVHVMHVTGYAASFGFDAPKNAQTFTVYAILPTEEGVSTESVAFKRSPIAKQLHITLRSDRARYEPGDPVRIDALVTDVKGRPVRTELSLGVVDQAIYAVQNEQQRDPLESFYGNESYVNVVAQWYRPNYVAPRFASEQGVPSGTAAPAPTLKTVAGSVSDVYSVGAVKIRTNFQDTAYWTPAVVTDAHGHARIAFTWPDNLTTWRTNALGVTAASEVGSGHTDTLVTKDFLVRLEMPRFLRKGDRSTIAGIAQGKSDAPRVTLSLVPDAIDPLTQLLRLDEAQSATASWPFAAGDVLGDRMVTLTGSDGSRNDAMQLPLPIESAGAAEHVRDASDSTHADTIAIALPPGYDAGTLHLTLTPSVAAQLLQNVRVLDVYPYYCTEQTMSAALPAIFVDRLFRRSGLDMPSDVSPPQVIEHAIERLQELQHDDGSWGWWERDAAHPFMTAYALYGLAEFQKEGYAVPSFMYTKGVDSLVNQLATSDTDTLRFWGGAQSGSEWNTRAFMLFSLADANPSRVDRGLLARTLEHADRLNSYALSVLGLTYHELHDDVTARRVLTRLNARAVSRDSYTFWTGDTWHYAWEDDPIETTAYALRLNAALQPGSEIVSRAVAFLRSEQHGAWWYTTKDTAAAVYAIAEAERPAPSEFHPDETVSIVAGGRTVKTLRVHSAVLNAADAEIDVPASLLHDGVTVRIVRTGTGALYWSSDFTRYAPWSVHAVRDSSRSIFARLFPKEPPLRIDRSYRVDHSGSWRIGDVVHVDVTVTASDDVQYVAIEDPFPAGVEYAPPQGEGGTSNWSGVQFFDDRAVFFADEIYRSWPLHLSYDLRVTTDGAYAAPPPIAYAMYGPPVSATGSGEQIVVRN